jgi:glucose/arabinose dehydrogenase
MVQAERSQDRTSPRGGRARRSPVLSLGLLLALSGCFPALPADGGGMTDFNPPREVDPADVALPEGYEIEAVATGLTFPTDVTFDEQGRVYVTEAGYSYGDVVTTPRLLRLEPEGSPTAIASGTNPPWNGVEFHEGDFFVAGGHLEPGQLLRVSMDGTVTTLIEGLPSLGDHHTNGPAVGPDGFLYFGQGTATNSGVVGLDNFDFGWPTRYPDFHDVPCQDVVLTGQNYRTTNPLTPDPNDEAVTGAYVPFGTPTEAGQVIPGSVPCGGAVMRVSPEGGTPELVAWGFRNPFGLAFAPDGTLYAVENQYDVRGSRPVFGTGDLLWRVVPGTWYGWPDFFAGRPITEEGWFGPPGKPVPGPLLRAYPNDPPEPAALLGVHSSSNGADFSRNPEFGHAGEVFIAQFGDMAPGVGKVLEPVGYKVVRVDPETGVIHDFAANFGESNGPASYVNSGGLERPVNVKFGPGGDALYVVDFGVMTTGEGGVEPRPGTGVLWRITREEMP